MMSMLSRDTFGGCTFAAFTTKNIPVVVALMISLSLIEPSIESFVEYIIFIATIYSLTYFSTCLWPCSLNYSLPCSLTCSSPYKNTVVRVGNIWAVVVIVSTSVIDCSVIFF